MGITGASYGEILVNWLVTQRPFAAAVSQRSAANFVSWFGTIDDAHHALVEEFGGLSPYEDAEAYWSRSPLRFVGNVSTPLLLIQAGRDHRTPLGQAEEFFAALRFLGKRARLAVFADEMHYVRRHGSMGARMQYTALILEWMQSNLLDDVPQH